MTKTVKNIILSSIGVLSGVMLLVGLCFYYSYMPIIDALGATVGQEIVEITADSGFSTLGGESVLAKLGEELTAISKIDDYELDTEFIGILFQISSIVVLALACLCILVSAFSFLVSKEEKVIKMVKKVIIFAIIGAIIYLVVGIVSTVLLNYYANEFIYNEMGIEEVSYFKTASFWPLIFQVLICVAYVFCVKFSKVKFFEKKSEVEIKAEVEKNIPEIIRKYKKMFDDNLITVLEFEKKKQELLLGVKKVNAQAELDIADALVEYRRLYDDGLINLVEYEKKKDLLLKM